MLKNVYILHHEDPKSKKYLQDCINSCSQFPKLNTIPVVGPTRANFDELRKEFNVEIIPFYANDKSYNGVVPVFSCNAGHYRIWQKIVESGEPSVVLEHDAIVKYDFSSMKPVDGEILWLGPRIDLEYDYNVPQDVEYVYMETDRFEGTHAYAVTPATAAYLIECHKKYGFNDSIDGQLGMRNIFDLNMRTLDPPPVVAVVGTRSSCIETTGNPAFWNAYNTERFLSYVRPGAKIAPERKLYYSNKSFDLQIPGLLQVLDPMLKADRKVNVLVIGGYEGRSTVWLSNQLLNHNDSQLHTVSSFRGTFEQKEGYWPDVNLEDVFRFNTYFSKYYFKLNVIPTDDVTPVLLGATTDPDIKFDVIYVDGEHDFNNVLSDAVLSYNLLKDNGLIIFDDMSIESVKLSVDIFAKTINNESIYRDQFISVYRK
jgi:predicted O-methyltransferase YrrM